MVPSLATTAKPKMKLVVDTKIITFSSSLEGGLKLASDRSGAFALGSFSPGRPVFSEVVDPQKKQNMVGSSCSYS